MPDVDAMLHHIRHAEEWLRSARGDCRRGDVRSALLRLLLAEAEIRHAREADPPLPVRPSGGLRTSGLFASLGAAAAVAVAAAVWYAAFFAQLAHPVPSVARRVGAPAAQSAQEPLGVVQLESGRFLTLVPPPQDGGAPSSGWETPPAPFFDERGHFGDATPSVLGQPVSIAAPGDPGHRQASSF
jgi:hypothetical protein